MKAAVALLCGTLFALSIHAQTRNFSGSWTKEGTTYVFDFMLKLDFNGNNVQGQFHWVASSYDKHEAASKTYYESKIGKSATEYVRGYYNPSTGDLTLRGYKKDDPHFIIALDEYKLEIMGDHVIRGITKANGTWEGIIDGVLTELDL